MKSQDAKFNLGQVRVYENPNATAFVIGWDPSLGTGGDMAAIEIYRLPDVVQIAEWQHNKTDIQGQLRQLVSMLRWLESESPEAELYWSVENNSIGEAALVSIKEFGEENIPGNFVQEVRKPGQTKGRRGFNTTHKSKITSCMRLKSYIEGDKMTVRSHNLLREMKNFIARGSSFCAKEGETDDLVMSTILALRIIEVVMAWDQPTYEYLINSDTEEAIKPMPIGFL